MSTSIGSSVRLSFFPLIFLAVLVAVFASFGLLFLLSFLPPAVLDAALLDEVVWRRGFWSYFFATSVLQFWNCSSGLGVHDRPYSLDVCLSFVLTIFPLVPFSYLPLVNLVLIPLSPKFSAWLSVAGILYWIFAFICLLPERHQKRLISMIQKK